MSFRSQGGARELRAVLTRVTGPTAGAGRCTTDEVGIDFPAVAVAVERACAGFFAAAGAEPRENELRLTRDEATRGGPVLLEMPLELTCDGCGGRGEVWDERCGRCGATGCRVESRLVRVRVPAGVRHGSRFRMKVMAPEAVATDLELRIHVSTRGAA